LKLKNRYVWVKVLQIYEKATFIIRLWTDGDPLDENSWRGTAEHIGSGQSHKFQRLDELNDWLRQELA